MCFSALLVVLAKHQHHCSAAADHHRCLVSWVESCFDAASWISKALSVIFSLKQTPNNILFLTREYAFFELVTVFTDLVWVVKLVVTSAFCFGRMNVPFLASGMGELEDEYFGVYLGKSS